MNGLFQSSFPEYDFSKKMNRIWPQKFENNQQVCSKMLPNNANAYLNTWIFFIANLHVLYIGEYEL